jgi:hypothetical protein
MEPHHRKFRALVPLLLLALGAGAAVAQGPPAQGPLLADPPARTIPLVVVVDSMKKVIQTQLDTVNARISRAADSTGIEAHLSYTLTTFKPGMSVTQYTDRPNENVVRVAFSILYDVTGIRYEGLPYPGREIGQSIELQFSCRNWFTGSGKMHLATRIDPAYLNGTSFGEDVLNFFIANTLTDLVDHELRARLPGGLMTVANLDQDCNRLGVDPGIRADYTDATINYKVVRFPRPLPTAWDASVTFQTIKRLSARTIRGETLYNEVEDIQLVFYANHTARSAELHDMREGEERTLNMPVIALGPLRGDAQLVLITNVEQLTSYQRDSRFRVFTRATGFGHGVQKLIVGKTYWEPPRRLPDGRLTKPTEHVVDAYEITVLINAPPPLFTEGEPAAGPPAAGTRAGLVARPE